MLFGKTKNYKIIVAFLRFLQHNNLFRERCQDKAEQTSEVFSVHLRLCFAIGITQRFQKILRFFLKICETKWGLQSLSE